jgi:hypothetical protein
VNHPLPTFKLSTLHPILLPDVYHNMDTPKPTTEHRETIALDSSSGEISSHNGKGESSSIHDHGNADISPEEFARREMNAKLANPLAGLTHDMLEAMGEKYCLEQVESSDEVDIQAFRKGAVLAQDPLNWRGVKSLTQEDRDVMENEFTHRWSQPTLLYLVIVLCSVCAAVQGMGKSKSIVN